MKNLNKEQTNLEIASGIANTIFDMQIESEFFMGFLEEEGVEEEFKSHVCANDDHKEVMVQMMTANILAVIIREKHFKESHLDEETGLVGFKPSDIDDFDHLMANHIIELRQNSNTAAPILKEIGKKMQKNKYRVERAFVTYGYVDVVAFDRQTAQDIAGKMDGGDFIAMEENGHTYIESSYEID